MRQKEALASEMKEYGAAFNAVTNQYEKGEIDAIDYLKAYNNLAANAPGPLRDPGAGPLVSEEDVAAAQLKRQGDKMRALGEDKRADFMFQKINEMAGPIFQDYQMIKDDPSYDNATVERVRLEKQQELNRLYKPYMELASQLVAYGYQPFGMYVLEPREQLNADSGSTSTSVSGQGGKVYDVTATDPGAPVKERPNRRVSTARVPKGMDSGDYRKYIEGEIESLAED
jgi:hypothetical protein